MNIFYIHNIFFAGDYYFYDILTRMSCDLKSQPSVILDKRFY
jgi:hypothetical protein